MATVKVDDYTAHVLAVVRADTEAKLNQAGDMVRDTMKAEAESAKDTGKLGKTIRVMRNKKELWVKIIAGSKKVWWIHLVLFGTAERYTKKGAYRGAAPPNNFMQRSLDQNIPKLKGLFGRSIEVKT